MVKDKYEQILNRFELYYPNYYNRAIDWWASGRSTIAVRLDTNEKIEYNSYDDSIRWIRTDEYTDNEERRRRAFGHNLEKMIPYTGMSKGELAEKLGITNAMLSRYIRGTSMPSADKAHQIARLIGCSTDEFFDDTYMED